MVPLILIFSLRCFQGFPAIHFLLASMNNSTFAGMHSYQTAITRGQCFTIILGPKLAFMGFLALGCCMLFFFVFLFTRNHSEICLIPSLTKTFDSHYSTTSDPPSCSDRYPVKASCRSRACCQWKHSGCFPGGLNSICVL